MRVDSLYSHRFSHYPDDMLSSSQIGRPRRYSEYETLLRSLPKSGMRRPKYVHGIGIFRGSSGDTAWIKIRLRHDTVFRGRGYSRGSSIEIKLGKLSSWSWRELEAKRDALQGCADREEVLEAEPFPDFETWAMKWLELASKRLRSFAVVAVHARTQLIPRFGKLRLDQIGAVEINDWVQRRSNTAAPATVKRELSTLSAILGSAVRARKLGHNPCADAEPIRGVVGRQRFLTGTELLQLLSAAGKVDTTFPDLLLWFVHSGMRRSEVLGLRWSDIRTLHDGRCFAGIQRSKSDTTRFVTCTRTMIEVLERQALNGSSPNDRVFTLSSRTLRRRWDRLRQETNLANVTIHDLRRTHATHAIANGVDLRTLADRIGHGSLAMLQKHYAAVVGNAASEAATKVQSVFDTLLTPVGVSQSGQGSRFNGHE